jgi:hypothetical protein
MMSSNATFRGWPAARASLTAAVCALLLAVVCTTSALGVVPVTGDQAAWQEITGAFKRLEATTYRMTMTAPGQTVLLEHVPPNARRTLTTITGQVGEIESIAVGGETRFRVIRSGRSAAWMCGDEGPQPPMALTVEGLGMAVHVARRPDLFIVGAPARTYLLTYTFRGRGAGHETTVYVDRKTALPRRSVTPYPQGAGTIVNSYYDYGARIAIALPSCG